MLVSHCSSPLSIVTSKTGVNQEIDWCPIQRKRLVLSVITSLHQTENKLQPDALHALDTLFFGLFRNWTWVPLTLENTWDILERKYVKKSTRKVN